MAPRIVSALIALIGIVSAILVATHPAGIPADWMSWLGSVQMIAFATLAILPSIFKGEVTIEEAKNALEKASQPSPLSDVPVK